MGDTRERILSAAEVLFAERGYTGASLRDITAAAEVNTAAVNYHFGSKEGLLVEVLDRILGPMTRRRIALLDRAAADAAPGRPTVEVVLAAFLRPDLELVAELAGRDPRLPRFVSRMSTEGTELMSAVITRQFAENRRRFIAALGEVLPELDEDEIDWRLHAVVGVVVYVFAGMRPDGSNQLVDLADIDGSVARLVAFLAPGFRSTGR